MSEEQRKEIQEATSHLPSLVAAAIEKFCETMQDDGCNCKVEKYYAIDPDTGERKLEMTSKSWDYPASIIFRKYHPEAIYFTIAIDKNEVKPKIVPAYYEREGGFKCIPQEWYNEVQMWQEIANAESYPNIETEEEGLSMKIKYLEYQQEKILNDFNRQINKRKWWQIWKRKN